MALSEENEKPENNSQDELLKIIKKQSEDFQKLQATVNELQTKNSSAGTADVLAQALQSLASKQEKRELDYEAGIAEEDIPVDDFMEQGVRFCAPFVGYVISDDMRKGQRVVLPYGKKVIDFNFLNTRITQTGKHQNVHPISAYTSRSKKEVEWLRKHSLYNIMFFETSTLAANADAIKATRLATIMSHLKNYEMPDLMARAKENGVPVSEDMVILRQSIAYAMLEKEMAAEQSQIIKTLEQNHKEAILANR